MQFYSKRPSPLRPFSLYNWYNYYITTQYVYVNPIGIYILIMTNRLIFLFDSVATPLELACDLPCLKKLKRLKKMLLCCVLY